MGYGMSMTNEQRDDIDKRMPPPWRDDLADYLQCGGSPDLVGNGMLTETAFWFRADSRLVELTLKEVRQRAQRQDLSLTPSRGKFSNELEQSREGAGSGSDAFALLVGNATG